MKRIFLALLLFALSNSMYAQSKKADTETNSNKTTYQGLEIVFQLTSADTLVHQTLMSQLKNYFSVAPDLKVEVVCHSGGLNMLVKETSVVQDQVEFFSKKGVKFVACEFSMAKKKITKDQLFPEAGTVTSGVLEVAKKQKEGWSYIKL